MPLVARHSYELNELIYVQPVSEQLLGALVAGLFSDIM
jgi:hypothetical protein